MLYTIVNRIRIRIRMCTVCIQCCTYTGCEMTCHMYLGACDMHAGFEFTFQMHVGVCDMHTGCDLACHMYAGCCVICHVTYMYAYA